MISEINIVPVKSVGGLVGFASFVYQGSFYVGSVGIHTRPDGTLRMVFPRVRGIDCIYPLRREVGVQIERAITTEYRKLFA